MPIVLCLWSIRPDVNSNQSNRLLSLSTVINYFIPSFDFSQAFHHWRWSAELGCEEGTGYRLRHQVRWRTRARGHLDEGRDRPRR